MILPPTAYQFLVGVFAALGSFLYGYDLTIVAEGQSVFAMKISSFTQMQKFKAKHVESGGQPIFLKSIPSLDDSDWACCISFDWRRLCRSWVGRFL
jgi:hypothetical protein